MKITDMTDNWEDLLEYRNRYEKGIQTGRDFAVEGILPHLGSDGFETDEFLRGFMNPQKEEEAQERAFLLFQVYSRMIKEGNGGDRYLLKNSVNMSGEELLYWAEMCADLVIKTCTSKGEFTAGSGRRILANLDPAGDNPHDAGNTAPEPAEKGSRDVGSGNPAGKNSSGFEKTDPTEIDFPEGSLEFWKENPELLGCMVGMLQNVYEACVAGTGAKSALQDPDQTEAENAPQDPDQTEAENVLQDPDQAETKNASQDPDQAGAENDLPRFDQEAGEDGTDVLKEILTGVAAVALSVAALLVIPSPELAVPVSLKFGEATKRALSCLVDVCIGVAGSVGIIQIVDGTVKAVKASENVFEGKFSGPAAEEEQDEMIQERIIAQQF